MRIIVHVDMDAFYAAVEERYNPALRGLPVVVGADPKGGRGRGVVTTANYAARRYGIHSALPISRAWRLAEAARRRGEPAAVFVRPNFPLYAEVSTRIMEILARAADSFEEASIDEAYLDLSSLGSFEAAAERMKALKAEIREKEGLGCSVGIGPNKLVAKIASGHQKPDGLTVVRPEEVQAFLDPLPVRAIPGIGPKSEAFLRQRKINTVNDLRQIPEATLSDWFGKWGRKLFEKARGIDDSAVSNEWTPKSIGEQETFERDTRSIAFVAERLDGMAQRVVSRLRARGFSGFRTLTLTVRFSDFETRNRSRSVKEGFSAVDDEEATGRVKREALKLLLPFFDARENPRGKAIRLVGLRLERLF
ncbi:MAG TPA: DNA polymerase IV [candidate division Zixibacteria bacterium]|nr:DNA polymerase IV [candidate division Zixibacteria bacterium]